jgi:hypothetical protein
MFSKEVIIQEWSFYLPFRETAASTTIAPNELVLWLLAEAKYVIAVRHCCYFAILLQDSKDNLARMSRPSQSLRKVLPHKLQKLIGHKSASVPDKTVNLPASLDNRHSRNEQSHDIATSSVPPLPDFSCLCKDCTKILDLDWPKPLSERTWVEWDQNASYEEVELHHEARNGTEIYARLSARATEGCELCRVLAAAVYGSHETVTFVLKLIRKKGQEIHQLSMSWGLPGGGGTWGAYDIRVMGSDFTQTSQFGIQQELELDMASAANTELVKKWMKNCEDSHLDCVLPKTNNRAPARLLDVGHSGNEILRLCSQNNAEFDGYVALSYCWGTGERLTTTLANLAALSSGFPLSSLPATIADAVIVTRQLGIRYLWVDSLSIIQDSKEDMRIELAKMADIYKNARLTIIAASASSAMDGFLKQIPEPKVSVRAPLRIRGKPVGALLLREQFEFDATDDFLDHTERRAWCLQESVLSRRCLVFSSLHMYWCCQGLLYARRGVIAETDAALPRDVWDDHGHRDNVHLAQKLPDLFRCGRRGPSLESHDHEIIYRTWRSLVAQYSSRQMSDPDDKFRAFSAIAQEFQTVSEDNYLAGAWSSSFGRSLLWTCAKGSSRDRNSLPAKSGVAPTWSWLSVESKVELGNSSNNQIEVINVDIRLKDPSEPFGMVDSGTLQVRGRLEKVLVWYVDDNGWNNTRIRKDVPFTSIEKYFEPFDHTDGGLVHITPRFGNWSKATLDHHHHENGKHWSAYIWGQEAKLWAFEVELHENAQHSWHASGETQVHRIETSRGLILVESEKHGEFKRVGVYEVRSSDDVPWFHRVDSVEVTIL